MNPSAAPASAAPIGVLLAAGRGRRMGGGKMLRRLPDPDGRPLVVAALHVLSVVCRRVVIITGTDRDAVRAAVVDAADRPGADDELDLHWVAGDPAAPMLGSIRRGLRELRRLDRTAAALVHPGDVPATTPATVRRVLAEARADDGERAVMPEFRTRGGHPVLLPPTAIDRVLALDDDHPGGLRAYWEANPATRRRVPVDDAGCRRDVDTPADLAAAASPAPAAPSSSGPDEPCTT